VRGSAKRLRLVKIGYDGGATRALAGGRLFLFVPVSANFDIASDARILASAMVPYINPDF
jgi:hypothetical protein